MSKYIKAVFVITAMIIALITAFPSVTSSVPTQKQQVVVVNNKPHAIAIDGFQVTWYNQTGKTASGRITQAGITCAVDPDVIPLGTWIRIIMPNGKTYVRHTDDTGGAVIGKVIDIYAYQSDDELFHRGRTYHVKVEILGTKI